MSSSSKATQWTAKYIEAAWKDIMIGEATEASMKSTFLKYTVPEVQWSVDGNVIGLDKLVTYCNQLRERAESVKVDVHEVVTKTSPNGGAQCANRHICYFIRKDQSTVSNECMQILDINDDGLIVKAVELARNFDDSREKK